MSGRHPIDENRLRDRESGAKAPAPSSKPPAVSTTAWVADSPLDLATWIAHGSRLGAVGRGVAWWIGDWLIYGNMRYGEKYSRAARVTGYDAQTLMNMVYVASRFSPSRRRASLSWSHHAEVAAIGESAQEHWLDVCEARRLSVGSLRLEMRAARRVAKAEIQVDQPIEVVLPPDGDRTQAAVICPNCNWVIVPSHGEGNSPS